MARSPRQLIEQATRHAAHLERLKTQDINELVQLLEDINDDILSRLGRLDITEFSRNRLESQLTALGQIIDERMNDEMVPRILSQVQELAQYEAGFEQRSLQAGVEIDFDAPSPEQVAAAVATQPLTMRGPDGGQLLEPFVRSWSDGVKQRVTSNVRSGYAQGLTTPQILTGLRRESFALVDRNMKTVVRTGLQHAANQARQATWQNNQDIVRGVRWVSTLDRRTSAICQSLDGQVFGINEGPRPPAHPGCRSTTVAALDERFAVLEQDATRFSRDPQTGRAQVGEVSANQTYYGWLKTQPASVQDSIVGPTRGKLLRNGGISAERFRELQLDRSFQPATLEQMRELEPAAFERANISLPDSEV